jgi:hypothetical protein
MRVLDRRDEADRRDRTHAGRRHHQPADILLTSDASKLLCDLVTAFLDRSGPNTVILHRMWSDGVVFRFGKEPAAVVA